MGHIKNTIMSCVGHPIKSFPMLRGYLRNGLTIFVYHNITDSPSRFEKEYGISVSIDTFRRQISWISNNFNIIHPTSLLRGPNLPKHSAMITFDDGFLGTFENGLEILKSFKIPSIIFLNMQAIIEQKPILSAIACFLNRYVPEFSQFAEYHGINKPYHLTLCPKMYSLFEEKFQPIDLNKVLEYQGAFADIQIVRKWDGSDLVVYGNHLYEHWNATALSVAEFEDQYKKNEIALSQLKKSINLFAFTYGQPITCFAKNHINLLTQLGAQRIFSTSGGLNPNTNNYLLGRMSLGESHDEEHLWFLMFKYSFARKFK